jgi:hypothetical protein
MRVDMSDTRIALEAPVHVGATLFMAPGTLLAAGDRIRAARARCWCGGIGASVAGGLLGPMLGSGSIGVVFAFLSSARPPWGAPPDVVSRGPQRCQ